MHGIHSNLMYWVQKPVRLMRFVTYAVSADTSVAGKRAFYCNCIAAILK